MATWTTFAENAPEMAALAEKRFTSTGLGLIGTLRSDGFPRISPVEPMVDGDRLALRDGYMVLGMMPNSTKALDLRRDPRMTLHSATADKNVTEGDAKLWGRALEVTAEAELTEVADLIERLMGWRPGPGEFHAFLPDILGVSTVTLEDKALYVTTWTPEAGVRKIKRDG
jgi:hypothetical protein